MGSPWVVAVGRPCGQFSALGLEVPAHERAIFITVSYSHCLRPLRRGAYEQLNPKLQYAGVISTLAAARASCREQGTLRG